MSIHKHAKIRAEFYAACVTEPASEVRKRFQAKRGNGEWIDFVAHGGDPTWLNDYEYRWKPQVILINGFEVPAPCRVKLQKDATYFVATPASVDASTYAKEVEWANDSLDSMWLKRGLIHLTREAAVLHGKALASFTENKE